MGFLQRLKDLFGSKAEKPAKPGYIHDQETGLNVETDDPMIAEVVARAFSSGKPVFATRDENGKVTIQSLDP